jgi:hypothetical protein
LAAINSERRDGANGREERENGMLERVTGVGLGWRSTEAEEHVS